MINTPRALTVALLLSNNEFEQYLALEVSPDHYNCHSDFADDLLVTKVMSKSKVMPTSFDKKQKAIDSFYEGERACRKTNQRIISGELDRSLTAIAAIIHGIIGDLSRHDLDSIQGAFRNGSGATVSTAGLGFVPSDKYRDRPSLTYPLVPFARSIMGDRLADLHSSFDVVPGNKFTTVPKNSKTDRGICIEPSLNMYGQLGIGTVLKARLKTFGVDLYDQSKNQELARKCQSTGGCTIDLSLASDSISHLLVYRLFSPRWFELFSLFRSPYTTFPDGSVVELEKFSSMGNGYTFELETLIFLATCIYACGEWDEETMSVYGDDIIIPRKHSQRLIETLDLFGFSVNGSKSFLAGRFFESCGTDWYDSMPVRPFYLSRDPSSHIPYPLQAANALRLYAKRRGIGGCDSRFRTLWVKLYQKVPKLWKHPVPESFGDTGVIVSELEHSCSRAKDGLEGYKVRSVYLKPVKVANFDLALCLKVLDGMPTARYENLQPPLRDRPSHLKEYLRDFALRMRYTADRRGTPEGNREIKRGYLGRPRMVHSIVKWDVGLHWV
jgi:hypothetical protein